MSRHVESSFLAFLERRLHPMQEARVRRHLSSCDRCRNSLAGYEQLTADMRLALRFGVHAPNSLIINWWDDISYQVTAPPRSWLPTAILPALLSAILISVPFALRSSNHQGSFIRPSGTLISVPSADGTNLPPFEIIRTEEPSQQHKLVMENEPTQPAIAMPGSTPAPMIPAPLAPTQP